MIISTTVKLILALLGSLAFLIIVGQLIALGERLYEKWRAKHNNRKNNNK